MKDKLKELTVGMISEVSNKFATSSIMLEQAGEKEMSELYARLNVYFAYAITMMNINIADKEVMDKLNVHVPLTCHDILIKEAIKCASDLSDAINDPANIKDNDRSREALGELQKKLNEYIDMNQKWFGEYEALRKEYEE